MTHVAAEGATTLIDAGGRGATADRSVPPMAGMTATVPRLVRIALIGLLITTTSALPHQHRRVLGLTHQDRPMPI